MQRHDKVWLWRPGGSVNYHLYVKFSTIFVDQVSLRKLFSFKTKFYPQKKNTPFKVSSSTKIIVCWGNKKNTSSKCFYSKLLGLGRILSVNSIEYHGVLKLIRLCSKQWIRVGIWYAIIKLRPHNLWMFPILTRRRGVLMQIPLIWACVSTRNQDYFIEEPPPATPQ